MPLSFAYGANLDRTAMAIRCPGAVPLGPARLMNHRLFIMPSGYASVRPETGSVVHGLLWRLTPADVGPLDAFEEVETGLYTKVVRPVMRPVGSAQALIYIGRSREDGLPRPGYLEAVLASARSLGLPPAYCASLERLGRGGARGDAFSQHPGPKPAGPVAGVQPRFRSPLDRE